MVLTGAIGYLQGYGFLIELLHEITGLKSVK